MDRENKLYEYNGPVTCFGRWVGNYKDRTTASSKKQALSFLRYRYCLEVAKKSANSNYRLDAQYLKEV